MFLPEMSVRMTYPSHPRTLLLFTIDGGEVPGGNVPGGEVPGGKVPGGEVPGGEVPGAKVPGGNVPGGEVPVTRRGRGSPSLDRKAEK